ncbi:MAG TPA: hypothetical protein VJ841_01705 [Candidatus Saccharimonadales bacterium]|nr:hypothetical protein [Candidatus Saccharimonadales bacterium]
MKDIDFDELDRAVNSIMGGKGRTDDAKDANNEEPVHVIDTPEEVAATEPSSMPKPMSLPKEPTQETNPQTSSDDPIEDMKATSPENPETKMPPASKPTPAVRRGRFMDMVRPGAVQSTGVAQASRQGVTVEPTGPVMSDIMPSRATTTVSRPQQVSQRVSSEAAQETPTRTVEEPKVESTVQSASYTSPVQSQKLLDAPDDEMLLDAALADAREDEPEKPLESPFLAGTKVEKRPLGGVSSTQTEADDTLQPSPPLHADTGAQLTPNPADVAATPLPEELSTDVMALESDANTVAVPTSDARSEAVRQVSAVNEASSEVTQESTQAPDVQEQRPMDTQPVRPMPTSTVEPVVPKGPISIPQQYKEEPSTGDSKNGAIYDTDTYHHQPLAHPKKKKSGWMWVIWIILILIIGAAAGAALYWAGIF